MRKVFFLTSFCLAFATCLFCGCSPDDENDNNSSSTTTTTTQKVTTPKFDKYLTTTDLKSHAGYNSGTYIYYYVEYKNSVGSASSSISYTIVKR